MNTSLLKARQTKYAAYAALYIVVVLAVVTIANILADRYNKTYDGTANKRYSLSEQTAALDAGARFYLRKPYQARTLLAAIDAAHVLGVAALGIISTALVRVRSGRVCSSAASANCAAG